MKSRSLVSIGLGMLVVLGCIGCNADKSEITGHYGPMDLDLSTENSDKLEPFLASDFKLDTTLDASKVFIYDITAAFGAGDYMKRDEFKHRLYEAGRSGDSFHTEVGATSTTGDTATVDFVRTQNHAGALIVRYTARDDWKKYPDGWKLQAEHIQKVDIGLAQR